MDQEPETKKSDAESEAAEARDIDHFFAPEALCAGITGPDGAC